MENIQSEPKKETTIIQLFNAGIKKNIIKKKFEITDWQFAVIVRNAINSGNKTASSHSRRFKLQPA